MNKKGLNLTLNYEGVSPEGIFAKSQLFLAIYKRKFDLKKTRLALNSALRCLRLCLQSNLNLRYGPFK